MKRLIALSLLMTTSTLLTACTIRADIPNRMVIDSDGIVIDSKNNKKKGDKEGYFCPPGQAKKGNC
ncbi:hypothetical protein [Ignatzschineria cameli]|uniref:hypothetical protein n=1 Tax=Ignatzschineria cameli TaxID=2182793 RepID=UPI000D60C7D5|nr:hypothetical protein [Ignatzschineria cameli]PWD85648.1 hypothetical protein DC080_05385 [Ignatzschineria cameli]